MVARHNGAIGYPRDFPRNHWYIAAMSSEVTGGLMSRWILSDPVCLYRRGTGEPVALVDRCIHRQMPLSEGRLRGDTVECGYHGIVYNWDGRGLRIPSKRSVPPSCRVHAYPLVESCGVIWIWMGAPELADQGLIPDHHWMGADGWATVGGRLHMDARAQLLNENLLDLTHTSFLHPESIGTAEVAERPCSTEFDEASVRVTRTMEEIETPPFFERVMNLSGLIDRVQVAEFRAPGFHVTHISAAPTGTDDPKLVRRHKNIHGVTPERASSTHYFWFIARDYYPDDPEVSRAWAEAGPRVFSQDVHACEAIERVISVAEPGYPVEMNLPQDAGPLRARRMIHEMNAAEAGQVQDSGTEGR